MKNDLPQGSIEPLLSYFDRIIPLNKEEKELVTAKSFSPHAKPFHQYVYLILIILPLVMIANKLRLAYPIVLVVDWDSVSLLWLLM